MLLFAFLLNTTSIFAGADTLRENFKNPPRQYSLLPFWAWNDTLEPEKIKWQIDQMVEKHVYGAFMHARVGINKGKTPYFSEGWWKAIEAAITHGKEVGFYPWLYDEDKWPSGSAGGRTAAVNPEEFTQKGLVYSAMEITGPQEIILPSVDKPVGIIAARFVSRGVVDEQSLTDISSFAGKSWPVPEGKWMIMTLRQISEEKSEGEKIYRSIDYLDKDAVATFIKITHEEYHKRFGEHFGSLIPGIFFDEISARLAGTDFAWTDDFLGKFQEIKGYDLKKYLPLLVYDGGDITPKVRCDYYDVFTTLYEEAWFKQISDWCSEHNILLTGHTYEDIYSYITQGDYFRTLGHLQIPLTDNEEFRYSFPVYIEWFKPKQLASIAHINGRKLAGAEALGGNNWAYTLEELRYGISMLGVYGINFMVLHGFFYTTDTLSTSSDYPPSWFYQNPYWKYFGQVGKFAQRILYMGRQGNHVCDVAILQPITSQWASGRREGGLGKKYTLEEMEDILSSQYYNIQKTLLDNQIDYDIITPGSLLKCDVSGGTIKIAKGKYSVLILPPLSVIRRDVLEKIKNFYENAGTVIALNTLPLASMEAGRTDSVVIQLINDIFGFNPLFLRSGYYEIDPTYTERFITNSNEKGGRAYLTKDVQNVPSIVAKAVEKDVIIKEGDPAGFRFLHNATDDFDIYHIINEQKVPRTWTVSFKATGTVERWHPETGKIEPLVSQNNGSGRTLVALEFQPWENCYIIFDKTRKPQAKKDITRWVKTDNLTEINLSGKWSFVVVGDQLDYKWQSKVESSQIELPVMDFFAERAGKQAEIEKLLLPSCEGIRWKQIKLKDKANKVTGCGRYLSCWDGWWITYTDLKPHWGTLGGDEITFRKEVVIDEAIKSAWLGITADKEYRFYINGRLVGEDNDWKNAETYDTASYLKAGANLFEVIVKNGGSLLLQGKIVLSSGKNIDVLSDGSWQAANKSGIWAKAFEYVNPPLGPWGNIELDKQPLRFPLNVWYRQELPAGAVGITAPVIKGDYKLFINGQAIDSRRRGKQIDFKGLLDDGRGVLLIKVSVKDFSDGLIEPVTILCEPTKVRPDLWENYGLDWYSGRCLYSKEFVVPDEYINADTRLTIDLGEVKYFAEVWINDKLAGVRIWPPYEVQIQDYVRAGSNTVSLVIANLIVNKMKWDVFDESLTSFRTRWGHDLCLLRRPDIVDSGVLGPIKIIPLKKIKLEVSAEISMLLPRKAFATGK